MRDAPGGTHRSRKQALHASTARRVYWANSFFSLADRAFNDQCARVLRDAGFEVFSPQETRHNTGLGTRATSIFRSDFAALRGSHAIVACLDAESIDAGVACEIGCAFSLGIPIVGLLTDLRWRRTGERRIYKNLFVTGCIRASGGLVFSVGDLVSSLRRIGKR